VVTRHAIWQAGLAILGIALVFAILFQLAASQVTVVQPAEGGVYVEGVLGYASLINPVLTSGSAQTNTVSDDVAALAFEGLTALDDKGRVSPALATGWEATEGGTVFEFQLRRGVSWHDGAPFTAADVVFTIQAIQDPQFQGDPALQALWRSVTVEQVDDFAVRFALTEPFPSFLYYTTIGLLPAHLLSDVPAADLPATAFSTSQPIGTGLFMVESVSPERVVLVANPTYWGRKPFLERVEFWSFGDEDALLASYERGEIDAFRPSRSRSLSELARLAGLQLFSSEQAGYDAIFLNLKREAAPFFQTLEVRQAMLYSLDRQVLIDTVLGGQGLVADSPLPPMLWAHDPAVRQYTYDPVRAAGLLDASGWLDSNGDRIRDKGETPFRFELLTGPGLTMARMAAEVAQQWRAIGIDATVRQVGADELPALVRIRDFDAILTEVTLSGDPDPYPLWHSTQASQSGQNISGFSNEQADLAMEEARTTADPERQAAAYATFQQIFAEQVPALLLYYPIYTYAVDSRVHGVQLSPVLRSSDRFRTVADWYKQTAATVITGGAELDNPQK
jgi:peptide/nickel transport system substrate-binding protein